MNLKTPFFSRKNILTIAAVAFTIYALGLCGVLIKNRVDHNRDLRADRSEEERIKSLSREEQSIQKAQAFLKDYITLATPVERLFLDYIQRKFELESALGVAGPPFDLAEDPQTYPEEIHFLARIAYPERLAKMPPKNPPDDNLVFTNIYSSSCDHLPLPDNYWSTMNQSLASGGYYLTHVALAFAFMKDNNCVLPSEADDMKVAAVEGMAKLAGDPNTPTDLRYEAMAFLSLSNQSQLVLPEWISHIVSNQQDDGGWAEQTVNKKPNIHTTILALWALLEYARPNAADVPMIRRPTR